MRQGKVQPLSVTTGLYGRPELGGSGGCVLGDDCTAASGTEAAPALLTAAAPSTAALAVLRKLLRGFMVIGLLFG
jgi:hypothetical protein